ncbi:MAG: transporter [Planctomycetia bacterium]|nr:transporter [Planctomycetia bacterium]
MRNVRHGRRIRVVAWGRLPPTALMPIVLVSFAAAAARAAEPEDAALASPRPWTRFLAEAFPEGLDPERSRQPLTIREPGPDTANYPNSPNTLPRGGVYLETSPVFFTGAISSIQPQSYNFEYLLRMGLTDRVEFRLFSSGFTWQAAGLGAPQTTGMSPLTFDTKIHFWEENRDWFLPAVGFEAFVQTPWGSPAFNAGTQPGLIMLFRNTLFWGLTAEYNVGVAADSSQNGYIPIDVVQWAISKSITDDFQVFVHGFQNESALPRVSAQTVVGGGFVWFPSDRLSMFGNWGAGTDKSGPATTFQLGFAGAF